MVLKIILKKRKEVNKNDKRDNSRKDSNSNKKKEEELKMRALVYKLSDGRVVKTLAEAKEAQQNGLTYKEQLISYDLDAERKTKDDKTE